MSHQQWTAVDQYLSDLLAPHDSALAAAAEESQRAGLPSIAVTPNQGKLLHLLARMRGVRTILEIGTLGGYSTIWLARALPAGGRLITLESDPRCAEVANANIARAGLADVVELRMGPALDTLPSLADEGHRAFDFIFIDADKENTPEYFLWALRLSRVGSLIVVDNVVRDGAIVDEASSDASVQAMRRFFDVLAACPQVDATAVQTVGSKGYDGFAIALVTAESWPA
jgi:predicted O-methyltransferase YrrM